MQTKPACARALAEWRVWRTGVRVPVLLCIPRPDLADLHQDRVGNRQRQPGHSRVAGGQPAEHGAGRSAGFQPPPEHTEASCDSSRGQDVRRDIGREIHEELPAAPLALHNLPRLSAEAVDQRGQTAPRAAQPSALR